LRGRARREEEADVHRTRALWGYRLWLSLGWKALFGAVMLAGLYSSVFDFLLVGVGLFGIFTARRALGRVPRWVKAMLAIPLPIRLTIGAVLTVIVGTRFISSRFVQSGRIPVLVFVALTGLSVMSLILPEEADAEGLPETRPRRLPAPVAKTASS
jgi:hypothetical protein